MKFVQNSRQLAINMIRSVPNEYNDLLMHPRTLLIGRRPYIKTKWMGSDNELSFKDHVDLYGPTWKYCNYDISYDYNQYGHRTDVYLNQTGVWGLAIGCSGTEGHGLALHDLWHQKLGIPVYNAGVAGSGNDMSLHNLQRVLQIAKPTYIFFQLTAMHRYFVVNADRTVKSVGIWDVQSPMGSNYAESVKESMKNDSDYARTIQLIDLAQTLADMAGSKIIFLDSYSDFDLNYTFDDMPANPAYTTKRDIKKFSLLSPVKMVHSHMGGFDTDAEHEDLARDCFHVGSKVHDEVAEQIKNLM